MGFAVGLGVDFTVGVTSFDGTGVFVGDFFTFGVAEGVDEGVMGPGVGV